MRIKLFFLILYIIYSVFTAYAFEPDFSIGTSSFLENSSEDSQIDLFTAVNADIFQRTIYDSGYYSWYAGTDFQYNVLEKDEYEDFEIIALDFYHEKGSLGFEGGSTSLISLHNIDYSVYIKPDWTAALLFSPDQSYLSLRLDYMGSLIFQDRGYDDRIINSLEIRGSYDPSLRFGSSLSLKGGIENYSEYYRLNDSGSETGTLRDDKYISASISFEGLCGFFSDWEVTGVVKILDSNANRFINSSVLENESEDYTSLRLDAEYNWSPLISLELSGLAFCEYYKYAYRNELDSSGELSGSKLTVLETGGTLEAGWTADNSLYWIFSVSFYKGFSSDTVFDEWNSSLGGRIKYSF